MYICLKIGTFELLTCTSYSKNTFASGGARECISQIQIIIIQSFRNWFPYFSSFLSLEVDTFVNPDVDTFGNPDVDTFGNPDVDTFGTGGINYTFKAE